MSFMKSIFQILGEAVSDNIIQYLLEFKLYILRIMHLTFIGIKKIKKN